MRQYKQLTLEQRYTIKVLKQENCSNRYIAEVIKVHYSTVYRELKRNIRKGYKSYRYKLAHRLALNKRRVCRKPTILNGNNRLIIYNCLQKGWSPEQISGWLKRHNILNISHRAIYNYIRTDKAQGGNWHKLLRRKRKYRKRYAYKESINNRTFIDDRPAIVDQKNRIGDWEVDTMISRKHKDVLVTLVERYSKFSFIGKAPSKHSYHVSKVIRKLLRGHHDKILTISSDNGTEFAQHERISKWLNADYYFCHPYCSWERGLNENTNGLIRQYVPKGSSFSHLSSTNLNRIMSKLLKFCSSFFCLIL